MKDELGPQYMTISAVKAHPAAPVTCDSLPRPALNLARRVSQLAGQGDGHYTLQLVFTGGRWLLMVDGGRLETLGEQ